MKTTSLVVLLLVFCCTSSIRAGTLEWIRQLGTSSVDSSRAVSADGLGNVYISGWTDGSLEGTNAGERDAFVAKYRAVVPEPATGLMLMLGVVALLIGRRTAASKFNH